MAPNPIMVPRKRMPRRSSFYVGERRSSPTIAPLLVALSVVVALVATLSWPRRWLISGAAIETLLIIYGSGNGYRIFPDVPLWTLLSSLNLIYAICSTSWLLFGAFSLACYPTILLTSLSQFPAIARMGRVALRKCLGQYSHFIHDKVAFFNLPALEIDTDVDGLFVIRGITFSISSLTLVAHGIELGLKLADDIELAAYADEVTIRFFRSIEIGDVYANLKGGKFEMTFGELDDPAEDDLSEVSVPVESTLLRAATAGAAGFKDRPKLRESFTGVSYVREASPREGLDEVQTLSPDGRAYNQYHKILTDIRTDSAIYQSRQQVRKQAKQDNGVSLDDEHAMRAAVCAQLHTLPTIVHPPNRSIRVTTLQTLSPPKVRRFLHRLPFLLRALLAPLGYFHPVSISSMSAAGSGEWLSSLLQQKVFKSYTASSAELRRLHRRVSQWLADANFCLQLTDVTGLGQVPVSTYFDIVTYLRFDDVLAYRTARQEGKINQSQVVRLGGADATFTIPSYLMPHHEHIIPPKPSQEEEDDLQVEIEDVDNKVRAVQAEQELKKMQRDEATVSMSAHVSLPASCDQSLLNFIAALVKATKIIELEKEADEADPPEIASPISPSMDSDAESIRSMTDSTHSRTDSGFRTFTKNIRQNLRDGTTGASIKEFAKDLHQHTKDGMKRAAMGGLVNDRWIAKLVGKTAAMLQKAQGDLGYSGGIPVSLKNYRARPGLESKLLP